MDLSPAIWREIESASMVGATGGGKWIEVRTLRKILRESRRTLPQNSFWWSLLDDALRIGGEALRGWDKDDLHEYALGEFFGWDQYNALGKKRLKPKRRSSRLSKKEMADLIDWFVRKMAGYGIVLELPGDSK